MLRTQRQIAVIILMIQRVCWCFLVSSKITYPPHPSLANRCPLFWSMYTDVEGAKDTEYSLVLAESRLYQIRSETYDLHSPRKWLEYCEAQDGREGAYTVLRCDFSPTTQKWNTWGLSFHVERLVGSYEVLRRDKDDYYSDLSQAKYRTNEIMTSLMNAAENSMAPSVKISDSAELHGVYTLMLTVLWTPKEEGITIRGHAFHSGQISIPSDYNPEPIVTSLACDPHWNPQASDTLPRRYDSVPEAKLSSWCRRRAPLEKAFKSPGIGEVLLTRDIGDDVELLEGLTSNLFVVYSDGRVQTPPADSVLGGYARQLVMEHAEECGLKVQVDRVRMSDASKWTEVFTTSSVRLITPVKKIVTVERVGGNTTTVWERKDPNVRQCWKDLYAAILQGQVGKGS